MFIVTGNGLPTNPYTPTGGATIALIDDPDDGKLSLGTITFAVDPNLSTSEVITIPSYTGDEIELTAPTGLSGVTSVQIAGNPGYTQALDTTNPQAGEYVFNRNTGTITVKLRVGESPTQGTGSTVFGVTNAYGFYPTDELQPPYPEFYSLHNLEGEVSFSRSFEGVPSASVKLRTISSQVDTVLAAFRNKTQLTLYSMGFSVDSTRFVYLPESIYPDQEVEVEIQLTGKWEYPLDEQPIRLLAAVPTAQKNNPQKVVAIASFLALNNIPYAGLPVTVTLDPDVGADATDTCRGLLEENTRIRQGFTFYSHPERVETRTFGGTRVHHLSDADIIGDLEYRYSGKEALYQGVQLVETYKNTVLTLDQDPTSDDDPLNPIAGFREVCDPKESPAIAPSDITNLREANLAFDSGGPTKTQTCRKYLGDTVYFEREVEYGFAFAAIDVHSYVTYVRGDSTITGYVYEEGINPASFWVQTKDRTTTYKRDSYGYLEATTVSGWELRRMKQESNNETLTLGASRAAAINTQSNEGNASANQIARQIEAYQRFSRYPSIKATTYDLDLFAAAFPDTPQQEDDEQIPANEKIPEKFVKSELTIENSIQIAPDPDGTNQSPKEPVVFGKYFEERKSTTIYSNIKDREAFYTSATTINNEGQKLRNALAIGQTVDNKGKPGPAQRDDMRVVNGFRTAPPADTDPTPYKYLLNNAETGYPANGVEQGSVSYPTNDPELARAAAELDLCITNTQGSETLNLTCAYNRNYEEGDMIWVRGKLYVIFGIQWAETFDGSGVVRCPEGMQLSLGRYLRVPVLLTKKVESNKEVNVLQSAT